MDKIKLVNQLKEQNFQEMKLNEENIKSNIKKNEKDNIDQIKNFEKEKIELI